MRKAPSICLSVVVAFALAAPAAAQRKPKPPPPPPPDSAADCAFTVEVSIPEEFVLASLNAGVRCATVKHSISVSAALTRDGVTVPVVPVGSDRLTCTEASECFVSFDLFSLDTQPVPIPGNQRYCASGSGVVGGVVLGPASACEEDDRL